MAAVRWWSLMLGLLVIDLDLVRSSAMTNPPKMISSSVSLGELEVLEGGSASLPCDMRLPTPDDAIYLVVWFMEPIKKPIYTFDARGKPLSLGRRWSEVPSFGLRADFRFSLQQGLIPTTGHLIINGTATSDEGLYRCRVDFKNSPARHYRVQLNVTVPSSEPEITDELGRGIRSSKMGSLRKDQRLVLQCVVVGGKPDPQIHWYLNGQLLPSHGLLNSDHTGNSLMFRQQMEPTSSVLSDDGHRQRKVHIEEIRLGPLKRVHQDAQITCSTSNSLISLSKNRTLKLDIQLPPIKVDILRTDPVRFAVGEKSQVRCQTYGSRPPATITWWKDDVRLPVSSREIFEDDDSNTTTSILKISFAKEDHGKKLTCRAVNRLIEASAVEDDLRLDIQFPPIAKLHLGQTLNPDSIKEGDDAYFECAIESNPDTTRLIWKHGERTLVYNVSAGVIMSNQSLVLRSLTRHRSGNYKCIGVNPRGEGVSNEVPLTVRYSPVCRSPISNIRGAERGESLTISCSVDALPRPTKFRWAMNTTRGWKDVLAATVGSALATSSSNPTSNNGLHTAETLHFRPELDDFGTVACWAVNDVGHQQEPCLFRFFPAGPPESLSNCSVLNQTADSLHVSCLSNDDGGLKQTFQLQAFTLQAADVMAGQPHMILHSESAAEFWLSNLEPGSTFMLYVYAVNVKGLSPPVILPVSTLKEAAKRTVPPTTETFVGSVASAVAMGTGVAFVLIATITVVAVVRCKQNQNSRRNSQPEILLNHQQQGGNQRFDPSSSTKTNGICLSNGSNGTSTSVADPSDEMAESAGFYNYRSMRRNISSPSTSGRPRSKLPPDFVANLSDAPESCV